MISYEPLWKKMQERKATSYTLIVKGGLGSGTWRRLKNGESVSTTTIDALCKILECRVEDIIEFVPDRDKQL